VKCNQQPCSRYNTLRNINVSKWQTKQAAEEQPGRVSEASWPKNTSRVMFAAGDGTARLALRDDAN